MINGNIVILVFGLPGAGKSTLINKIIGKEEGMRRLSGGTLIARELSTEDRDRLRKLEAEEILLNQEKLVVNFNQELSTFQGQTVLFDGHCVVKNGSHSVQVPLEVILRLQPDVIIFIDVDPHLIVGQRVSDQTRPDREKETIEQLAVMGDQQKKVCKGYCQSLKIPLHILHNPQADDLLAVVRGQSTIFKID